VKKKKITSSCPRENVTSSDTATGDVGKRREKERKKLCKKHRGKRAKVGGESFALHTFSYTLILPWSGEQGKEEEKKWRKRL